MRAARTTSIDEGLRTLSNSPVPANGRTLREIAAACDCDPESIRKIEKQALRKIGAALLSFFGPEELREFLKH